MTDDVYLTPLAAGSGRPLQFSAFGVPLSADPPITWAEVDPNLQWQQTDRAIKWQDLRTV
jgi:hypothetical protein